MGFLPYTRTFAQTGRPAVAQPMCMTRRVQRSFVARWQNHIAFKIVPQYRLPPCVLPNLDFAFEWGAQVMFSGGVLGGVVTRDLAERTEPEDVWSTDWEMPGLEDGETFKLFSVLVRSKGDAETFPPDPLMAMHAPDLAEETRGAHVFHFYDEGSSAQFQSLLSIRIHEHARRTLDAA